MARRLLRRQTATSSQYVVIPAISSFSQKRRGPMPPWRLESPARAPGARRYGVAVASVGVALVLSLLLSVVSVNSPFLVFFGAIAFSAWYGGLRPGLLATG